MGLGPHRPATRPTPMSSPPTRYADSDGASIAYQVVGEGALDLVLVLGFATHLELQWEMPPLAASSSGWLVLAPDHLR